MTIQPPHARQSLPSLHSVAFPALVAAGMARRARPATLLLAFVFMGLASSHGHGAAKSAQTENAPRGLSSPHANASPETQRQAWSWRRTSRGWEAVSGPAAPQLRPLAIHPLLLAAFQLLVSLGALMASKSEMMLIPIQMNSEQGRPNQAQRQARRGRR